MSPFEDSVQGAEKQKGYLGTLPHCWRLEWTLIGMGYANVVKDEEEGRQRPAKTRARLQGGPLPLHLLSCSLDLTVECGVQAGA